MPSKPTTFRLSFSSFLVQNSWQFSRFHLCSSLQISCLTWVSPLSSELPILHLHWIILFTHQYGLVSPIFKIEKKKLASHLSELPTIFTSLESFHYYMVDQSSLTFLNCPINVCPTTGRESFSCSTFHVLSSCPWYEE